MSLLRNWPRPNSKHVFNVLGQFNSTETVRNELSFLMETNTDDTQDKRRREFGDMIID